MDFQLFFKAFDIGGTVPDMKLNRIASISVELGVLLIIIGFIWLKLPRTLDAHFERAEQTVFISIVWSLPAGNMEQIERKEGDEDFARVLDIIRATKVQHAGLTGNFIEVKEPPLFRVYLAAIEGDRWREVGNLECDTRGNLYLGASHYTILDGADWLS